MDHTVNRGYTYPECDPPRVKDASDISQLRDLAEQINDDADALAARIVNVIEEPDAARISFTGNLTTSSTVTNGWIVEIPYNTSGFDSGGMVDIPDQGIRIVERGWYICASQVRCTNGGDQAIMCRHMRNGKTFSEGRRLDSLSTLAIPGSSATGQVQSSTTDTILCEVGDLVQTQIYINGVDGTYSFDANLTVVQLYPLDI